MRQLFAIGGLIFVATSALALFLARAGVSNVVSSGQAFTEKTAVSTLRTVHWAQGLFRRNGWLDADGDGEGEFGTFAQLTAEESLPGRGPIPTPLLALPGARVLGGVYEAHGYCFLLELPADADGRERRFVAHAWPRLASAGSQAFCIDQDEDILEQEGPVEAYGCERAPPPGSCPDTAAVDAGGTGWRRWKGKTSQLKVGALE